MSNLKHFKPKAELTASQNLNEFIRMCREDLTVFGTDLNWDATEWSRVCNFNKLGTHGRGYKESDRMDEALIHFTKAYVRYQKGHHPTKIKFEISALKVLEAALLQVAHCADIALLNIAILDEAAVLARGHYSTMAAYHCGRELQRLARFVSEKQLIPTDVSTWQSPINKPGDITIRTGAKAKAIQDKKLPNPLALDALAEIFANNPTDPADIFATSTFAMTMCAPVRISEIMHLPVDCEVEQTDSKGVVQYGWRFYSAKGFEGDIKWIPQVMVPIAKEAVRRIRELTSEARKLATWVECHPHEFYRHENCPNVSNDQALTAAEAADALGWNGFQDGLSKAKGAHTLNSLWKYVMARQPDGFPWLNKEKKIKYSNALFCMTRNFFHPVKGRSPVILWAPDVNVFNSKIGPRESLTNHQSIFDRHGYKASEGQKLKLTSHQARHLISTLANRGGLSQEQLAKWAGRADPKQNRVYNHMSEWEMVAKAEAMDTTLTLFGPKGEVTQNVPVTTQEINMMERGAMHISLWGVCSHDFIMSPCEKFRDCLNCEEHVCIKGAGTDNAERLKRIKDRLAQIEKDYAEAEKAIEQGYSGADRWYEHHKKTVERLRQLVQILESPDVPDGAQIKLRDGNDFSQLRRVIRIKAEQALEQNVPDAKLLIEMSRSLGSAHG